MVALDQQREGRRQVDALGEFNGRTSRRQIAHGAGNAAAFNGDSPALEHLEARCRTFLDHRHKSEAALEHPDDKPAKLRTIESNPDPAALRVQLSFTLIALKTRWRRSRESACCDAFDASFSLKEITMNTVGSMLFAAVMMLSAAPANAVVLDLSTMSCKQFIESGDDAIKMVLTWMDGWYKGDSDEAIID